MPLDPRSLNTVMGALSNTDAYQSAMQSVRQARDDLSDRVDALVDKGKAALGDVLSSVGAVVDCDSYSFFRALFHACAG